MASWINRNERDPFIREQAQIEDLQRARRAAPDLILWHKIHNIVSEPFEDYGFLMGWKARIDLDREREQAAIAAFVARSAKWAVKEANTSATTVRCADCQKAVDAAPPPTSTS